MGGISPVVITSISMLFFNPALSLSIFLSGFVGVIDDISRLNSKEKIILTFLMGVPVAFLLKRIPGLHHQVLLRVRNNFV